MSYYAADKAVMELERGSDQWIIKDPLLAAAVLARVDLRQEIAAYQARRRAPSRRQGAAGQAPADRRTQARRRRKA
jgi:hypothetical protein